MLTIANVIHEIVGRIDGADSFQKVPWPGILLEVFTVELPISNFLKFLKIKKKDLMNFFIKVHLLGIDVHLFH